MKMAPAGAFFIVLFFAGWVPVQLISVV